MGLFCGNALRAKKGPGLTGPLYAEKYGFMQSNAFVRGNGKDLTSNVSSCAPHRSGTGKTFAKIG